METRRLCPQCRSLLSDNKPLQFEGNKPSADWACKNCFDNKEMDTYVFYESEVLLFS